MTRAAWLEPHDLFEGVGAHELNRRYDHVDGGDWDQRLRDDLYDPRTVRTMVPALFAAQTFSAQITTPTRFDGADISHHQDDAGPIDWPTLRAASAGAWVATKATQSTGYVDPTFAAHRAQMAAQAFTHRLHYHWLSSTTDPVAQARHFLETVGDWHDGEGAMLDAEEAGITRDMSIEWHEVVEKERRRPDTTYTGAYVAGGTIWQSTAMRTSKYGQRPMHLAAYTTEAKALALPGVKAYPWDAWQYSSNGPVAGVIGRCDMNRIDNRAAYDLACGTKTNPQLEDDMLRLLVLTDSPARLFAMCDPQGRALRCEWTGPGDAAGSNPRIEFYRNATPAGQDFEMHFASGSLINISLDGVLPPGLKAEQFANADEIIARVQSGTVDTTARAACAALNDSVARLGQRQSSAGVEFAKAADALLGQ